MKDFIRCFPILMVLIPAATGTEVVMVYGQVGGTVTLPMARQAGDAKGYVYWTIDDDSNNKLLTRNNNFETWTPPAKDGRWKDRVSGSLKDLSMIIKDLKPDDFKTFTCEVMNSQRSIIKESKYQLLKMTVSPNSTVLVGESLSLNCEVQGGAKPKIRWVGPHGQTKQQPNVRSIAVSQDHGDWTCEVHVTHNDIKASGKSCVTVVDLSPGPSAPLYALVSSPLSIPCSIPQRISWELLKAKGLKGGTWSFAPLSGVPQTLFSFSLERDGPPTWRLDRDSTMMLVDKDPQKRDLSLSQKKAMEADRGTYTCALEFRNGTTLKRSVYMEVLKISSSPQPRDTGLTVTVGQQVNLTCSLGHALASDLQVKWQPPNQAPVITSSPQPHAIFTIAAVSEGDGGRWRCELVRNKTVLTSADIMLKIERAPVDIWLYLTIVGVTAIIILILILTVILMRRHRQQRGRMTRRHHRHQFCKCKNPKPKAFYKT